MSVNMCYDTYITNPRADITDSRRPAKKLPQVKDVSSFGTETYFNKKGSFSIIISTSNQHFCKRFKKKVHSRMLSVLFSRESAA